MNSLKRENSSPEEDDISSPQDTTIQYTRGEDCGSIDMDAPAIPDRMAFRQVVNEVCI